MPSFGVLLTQLYELAWPQLYKFAQSAALSSCRKSGRELSEKRQRAFEKATYKSASGAELNTFSFLVAKKKDFLIYARI